MSWTLLLLCAVGALVAVLFLYGMLRGLFPSLPDLPDIRRRRDG